MNRTWLRQDDTRREKLKLVMVKATPGAKTPSRLLFRYYMYIEFSTTILRVDYSLHPGMQSGLIWGFEIDSR